MGVIKLKRRPAGETMHVAVLEEGPNGRRPLALCDGQNVLEKERGHLWAELSLEGLKETNCLECAVRAADRLASAGQFPKR